MFCECTEMKNKMKEVLAINTARVCGRKPGFALVWLQFPLQVSFTEHYQLHIYKEHEASV